ncbi:MAG: [Fe-Fe] hydrogenase large subunit C-terminal domain-containing protein [Holophaga sp.]|jgi:signal transduction histidine kinase/ferredoxin
MMDPEIDPAPEANLVSGFVKTVPNRCRICYTCVRTCPAKAIRISKSQAEVVPERCIACGNCIQVCSQKAKRIVSTLYEVEALLKSGQRVAACIAPSFPVEFQEEMDFRVLVGMLRKMGFARVVEVGFGADLVAERYRQLLCEQPRNQYIATTCPAIVNFVERYQPELVPFLSPIVSPMVAISRALKQEEPDLKVVFVGPCVAKKTEAANPDIDGRPDVAITFRELRYLFLRWSIRPERVVPSDFDPPHPSLGGLFPVTRGFLQAASIPEDLLANEVVATDGLKGFTSVLEEFANGTMEARLLELLSCNGCIAGPGLSSEETLFKRRARVSHYTRYREAQLDRAEWQRSVDRYVGLDLTRRFSPNDQRLQPLEPKELNEIMKRMGKYSEAHELNCGACGYHTCREHALAIAKGFAESEMCLPFVIDTNLSTIRKLTHANEKLASAQETLMHSERLASMGQLAAGVAHEINNPLGVVLMYTHLLLDECAKESELRPDLEMIVEQANRCKRIVAGLLDFARQNKVAFQPNDIREVIKTSLANLATPDGITVEVEHLEGSPKVELDRDQMIQVFVNLVDNAFDAMPSGGVLKIQSYADARTLTVDVKDTGTGIPKENVKKLFEPFFTTKLMGKGTGLGLPVVYGIVKLHRGEITVESNPDPSTGPTGTTFRVKLPREAKRLGG